MFTCVNGTTVQILTPEELQVGRLIDEVKVREFEGWSFDRAEASFELLVKRVLKEVCPFSSVLPRSKIHVSIRQHMPFLDMHACLCVPYLLQVFHVHHLSLN
jgi:hypothetical protein